MIVVRVARLADDEARIGRIDTSFTTDLVYRVARDGLGFRLEEEAVSPPIAKSYPISGLVQSDRLFVAEDGGEVIGVAEVELGTWNRRAVVTHLYVSAPHRGKGAGRALLDALAERARQGGARCLWLETQNVNHAAVGFYRRVGMRLCGLDETFYDPSEVPGEVALFFARELEEPPA